MSRVEVDRPLELADRVRDAERRTLIDIFDLDAETAAVAEHAHDLEAEVADHDDDAADADGGQALDLMLEERLAEDGQVDVEQIRRQLLGDANHIGKNVRLAPGCTVERSVIMDGAIVEHPITIGESVAFPGVTVSATFDLSRTIVLPDQVVECR
jgi:acetyltransferase-like isoleucine patch superfamily enzyme